MPLLGAAPIIGLDGEADTLAGYRSPMHGHRPQIRAARDREEELEILSERLRGWIADGIEPHAIAVAARSGYLAKTARESLESARIKAASLTAKGKKDAVRTGTMHGMKGLEFQAVAVIGAEDGTVPAPPPSPRPAPTHSPTNKTCNANGASCSSPAPAPAPTCTSPIPASRARSYQTGDDDQRQRLIRGEGFAGGQVLPG